MGFEDRLKSKLDSLSIGQRKVGTYILTHLDESSYATLAQISRTANVSETTLHNCFHPDAVSYTHLTLPTT